MISKANKNIIWLNYVFVPDIYLLTTAILYIQTPAAGVGVWMYKRGMSKLKKLLFD